nr:PREDICTED: probable BOI-related E3 ubiquitin-protein ligase 2 [Musa acuminata subsp. malaccensis]
MWSSVAKNHETVAANLQASLEQVLREAAAVPEPQEGYGDTDDDAHSGSFADAPAPLEVDARRRRKGTCQACGHGKACVLLLPCRHLCLCKVCESTVDACPVCHSAKNCFIRVFIS